jgi:hypothetical protein
VSSRSLRRTARRPRSGLVSVGEGARGEGGQGCCDRARTRAACFALRAARLGARKKKRGGWAGQGAMSDVHLGRGVRSGAEGCRTRSGPEHGPGSGKYKCADTQEGLGGEERQTEIGK